MTARVRCLVPGCVDHGLWQESPNETIAAASLHRHYLAHHWQPLPRTDPRWDPDAQPNPKEPHHA